MKIQFYRKQLAFIESQEYKLRKQKRELLDQFLTEGNYIPFKKGDVLQHISRGDLYIYDRWEIKPGKNHLTTKTTESEIMESGSFPYIDHYLNIVVDKKLNVSTTRMEVADKNTIKDYIIYDPRNGRLSTIDGFVYFIRMASTNYYKIGITNDLKSRLNGIQTSCPLKINIVDVVSLFSPRDMEKEIHAMLKNKKTSGEWFELTESDVYQIQNTYFKASIKDQVVYK